ncbi:GCN5 family acetyltransferase [Bradyrhizobium macuxiense]|uniref:GCN5 family acetyltransferase n=1 Tax=Bradyrhizobium macuxiense TaxID=1755647 RepID=A0A120FRR1_9BRAD|nr:GNAT family N-acetyltransferase [Bradyrhizobium macuxiense]KWV60454.1 GCN5 family acetyltransferase [Bradyrhizobium macuxiense]
MSDAAHYTVTEPVRDGASVIIRALRPEDEADMLAALERTSAESRHRRFFVMKRDFSEKERTFFMNVDFKEHVALVAVVTEHGRPVIIGGGRYVVFEPGRAEMAFVVVDGWQGRGVGSLLMRHLARIARQAGLEELVADVLPENAAMLKVFSKAGLTPGARHDPQTVRLALQLARPSA